jgi:hypothetical protein
MGKQMGEPFEPLSESDFITLLNWHIRFGTKADQNPSHPSDAWQLDALAVAINKKISGRKDHKKSIENWLRRKHYPARKFELAMERIFFGTNEIHEKWLLQFRCAYDNSKPTKVRLKRNQVTKAQSSFRLRAAGLGEALLLFETLRAATAGYLNEETDISNPVIFNRWLATGKVLFCILETVDRRGQVEDVKGFYSIFPMTPDAFDELKAAALHHDDICTDHLVSGVFGARTTVPSSTSEVVLFVVDLEVILSGLGRKAAVYLTIDLLEQLRRASSRAKVVKVAALGATKAGKEWCETLGLQGADVTEFAYFPLMHNNWVLYEVEARKLSKYFEKMTELGWPKMMSQKVYPYLVDQQIEDAIGVLNKLLASRSKP